MRGKHALVAVRRGHLSMIRDAENSVLDKIDLDAALSSLTERQREVVLLYADGYTQREIGGMLEISHQSVSRILSRAGCKLRDNFYLVLSRG